MSVSNIRCLLNGKVIEGRAQLRKAGFVSNCLSSSVGLLFIWLIFYQWNWRLIVSFFRILNVKGLINNFRSRGRRIKKERMRNKKDINERLRKKPDTTCFSLFDAATFFLSYYSVCKIELTWIGFFLLLNFTVDFRL